MNPFDPLRKVMHVDEAVARFAGRPGTVFVHGVFDLLDRGHVAFLAAARQLGDRLVLAIAGDAVVPDVHKPLEHAPRHEGERAFLVAALDSVDAVVIVDEQPPLALLARLRPALHAVAGDHAGGELAESALLRSWGGRVIALPFVRDLSGAALIERIRAGGLVAHDD